MESVEKMTKKKNEDILNSKMDNQIRESNVRDVFLQNKKHNEFNVRGTTGFFNDETGNTTSRCITSEELEGFVHQINDDGTFVVNLFNVDDEGQTPLYRAELKKNSFSNNEQSQLMVGSKIRATFSKFILPNGEEKNVCTANLVPLPPITQVDLKNAYQKASEFLDSIEIE